MAKNDNTAREDLDSLGMILIDVQRLAELAQDMIAALCPVADSGNARKIQQLDSLSGSLLARIKEAADVQDRLMMMPLDPTGNGEEAHHA